MQPSHRRFDYPDRIAVKIKQIRQRSDSGFSGGEYVTVNIHDLKRAVDLMAKAAEERSGLPNPDLPVAGLSIDQEERELWIIWD